MVNFERRPFLLGGLACVALAFAPAMPGQADSKARLALGGYDPVAYFTPGKPTPGKPEFETVFDETRYRFASAENRDRFKADPDRYAPQFAGACAGGVSAGVKVEANPENFLIVDGKLFVFSGAPNDKGAAAAKDMLAQAGQNWPAMKARPFQ